MKTIVALACVLWIGVGTALAQSKKERALQHFEQAEAFMKTGAYDKAIAEYEQAYALVSKPGFLFNIGLAYEQWGKPDEALAAYEKYLELDPQGRAAAEARARADAMRAKVAERRAAEETARQASEAAAAGAKAAAAGDHDGAVAAYAKAFELSKDPEHVYAIAESYRARGDRAKAIAEYDRYRALAPTGAHVSDAVERTAELQRELAVKDAPPPVDLTPPPPEQDVPEPAPGGKRRSWLWIAAGVGVAAIGVVADLAPDSGQNGEWDATDFLPVGLYGLGGFFVYHGAF